MPILRGSAAAWVLTAVLERLVHQEWDQLSDQFAAYLHHETALVPGDRIAIQLPNLLHFPVALLGAVKAGLVVVSTTLTLPRKWPISLETPGPKLSSFCPVFVTSWKANQRNRHKLGNRCRTRDLQSPLRRFSINFAAKFLKSAVPNYRFRSCGVQGLLYLSVSSATRSTGNRLWR